MQHTRVTPVRSCRVCGADDWHTFLELGRVPLANSFVTDESVPEEIFPLALMSCRECRLMSLTHVVDEHDLYDHYFYVSSPSRLIHRHMEGLAKHYRGALDLGADSLVVEIGSNNGDQLAKFQPHGCQVLGIDPAQNITAQARDRGVDTRTDFFTEEVAKSVRADRGQADLIMARHVIAHIDDLHDLVAGVRELLAPDGFFALEVPYLVELINRRAFDTVYHEHLSYFLVGTLQRLFQEFGMRVVDVAGFDVHGGSIVVTVAHDDSRHRTNPDTVDARIKAEADAGLYRDDAYDGFADIVDTLRASLRASLLDLRGEGLRLAGYGASAKGVTLLTTSQVPPGSLDFCSDTTPEKQGTLIPGLGIPVVSPEEAAEREPDVYVLLAWNYRDEILAKEADFLERGGRFFVPIPEPRLVGAEELAAAAGRTVSTGARS
ncbi:class I SAM-dependent methyltransferase [Actinokineospora globicatena]|uniref:class I SAM-dependent methyltransferase n=1 Tax=Actinokineospora globicatena TaxID=103729 RepID=UPI0020A39F4A|nr:class I SAM-dependent methyltransferase [Actinokineospora globicatena]MCP2303960.1 Methyltransferase domain-containing protein [Actinokineospora globicatena]GLW78878.1 NDP-hexose 3-C-methyltransferase [Actinokineospora globicatena]GLW86709.1 NDP-hexose 3-C-methyltransferase [Actinokineospora globicatena]